MALTSARCAHLARGVCREGNATRRWRKVAKVALHRRARTRTRVHAVARGPRAIRSSELPISNWVNQIGLCRKGFSIPLKPGRSGVSQTARECLLSCGFRTGGFNTSDADSCHGANKHNTSLCGSRSCSNCEVMKFRDQYRLVYFPQMSGKK